MKGNIHTVSSVSQKTNAHAMNEATAHTKHETSHKPWKAHPGLGMTSKLPVGMLVKYNSGFRLGAGGDEQAHNCYWRTHASAGRPVVWDQGS